MIVADFGVPIGKRRIGAEVLEVLCIEEGLVFFDAYATAATTRSREPGDLTSSLYQVVVAAAELYIYTPSLRQTQVSGIRRKIIGVHIELDSSTK